MSRVVDGGGKRRAKRGMRVGRSLGLELGWSVNLRRGWVNWLPVTRDFSQFVDTLMSIVLCEI